eukprot:909750-Prymnesium_polylepis.1
MSNLFLGRDGGVNARSLNSFHTFSQFRRLPKHVAYQTRVTRVLRWRVIWRCRRGSSRLCVCLCAFTAHTLCADPRARLDASRTQHMNTLTIHSRTVHVSFCAMSRFTNCIHIARSRHALLRRMKKSTSLSSSSSDSSSTNEWSRLEPLSGPSCSATLRCRNVSKPLAVKPSSASSVPRTAARASIASTRRP